MIKKIFKWLLITIASLVTIVILFYAFVYFRTEARINKVYAVKVQTLTIPTDSSSYQLGRHIAEIRGCLGCHGSNLAKGEVFFNEQSPLGILYAANITSGKGGIKFTDSDWIKILRHGVDKQNKSVWFMPSHEVCHISNRELGALICFLKQQPPVDKILPGHSLKPLGRVLTFFNKFPLLPAEIIDHNEVPKDEVKVAVTAEYGGYLATSCKGCHGANFKGNLAHSPTEPNIPDISSTGHPGKWSDVDFLKVFRTGKTPEGKQLSMFMPWKDFTHTDDELKSIYLYLHQLK